MVGWYLYHAMDLWTLPFHLVEWEIRRVKRMQRQELPEAMRAWSQPRHPNSGSGPARSCNVRVNG